MLHKLGMQGTVDRRFSLMLRLAALFGLAVAEQQDITSNTSPKRDVLWHVLIIVSMACVIAVALKCIHLLFPPLLRKKKPVREPSDLEEGQGSDLVDTSSLTNVHQTSCLPIVHQTKSQMTITIVPPLDPAPLTEFQKLVMSPTAPYQTSQSRDDDGDTTRSSSKSSKESSKDTATISSSNSSESGDNEDVTSVYGMDSLGCSLRLGNSSSIRHSSSLGKSFSIGQSSSLGRSTSLRKPPVRPSNNLSRSTQQAMKSDGPTLNKAVTKVLNMRTLCAKEEPEEPMVRSKTSDMDVTTTRLPV